MPTEPTPLAWLQSRMSEAEHIEFHQDGAEYAALVCDSGEPGTSAALVRGDGPSLEEAVAALRRADAEQQGQ